MTIQFWLCVAHLVRRCSDDDDCVGLAEQLYTDALGWGINGTKIAEVLK